MWTLSTSQLYAVLKRLEEEGAIEGKQVFPSDAPAKMVYSVTDKGVSKLEKWIYDLKPSASIHRIRVLFLSRLYIADLLGISVTEIIENQKSVCEKQRIIFLNEKEKAGTSFEKLTLDFIIGQLEAALRHRPGRILLDNMKPEQLEEAVAMASGSGIYLEASGGITLASVAAVAACGVDAISIGCLTHSAPAIDLALEVTP